MGKRGKKDELFGLGANEGLGDLMGALRLDDFKDDLTRYSIMGAGALGAQVAWGYLAPFIPAAVTGFHPAVKPGLKVVAGVFAGMLLARSGLPEAKKLADGAAVGLVSTGLYGLVNSFVALPALGQADDDTLLLSGAPIEVETVSGDEASLAAAPVEIEQLAGVGSFLT